MGLMDGKKVLVMGVANFRSLAWGISEALRREGADLAFSYLPDERMKRNLDKLVMAVSTAVKESEWTPPRVGVA